MARGFDSKSVESQQADKETPPTRQPPMTDEQRDALRKREGLESSLRGLAAELAKSTSERRRADLAKSIAHIEAELKKPD